MRWGRRSRGCRSGGGRARWLLHPPLEGHPYMRHHKSHLSLLFCPASFCASSMLFVRRSVKRTIRELSISFADSFSLTA